MLSGYKHSCFCPPLFKSCQAKYSIKFLIWCVLMWQSVSRISLNYFDIQKAEGGLWKLSHMQKLKAENMHIRSAIESCWGSLAALIRYVPGFRSTDKPSARSPRCVPSRRRRVVSTTSAFSKLVQCTCLTKTAAFLQVTKRRQMWIPGVWIITHQY